MKSKLTLGLAALAAVWAGAWIWGRAEIRSGLDERIAEWRAQGVEVSYGSLEIGGFPFAYRGRIVEPRGRAALRSGTGPVEASWRTDWIDFASSLGDPGSVDIALPERQSLTILPPGAPSAFDVGIVATDLGGRFTRGWETVSGAISGTDLEMRISGGGREPFVVNAEAVSAQSSAPVGGAGEVDARVALTGATLDPALWRQIDPAEAFPRDPASVSLEGSAALGDAARGSAVLSATLDSLDADLLGLSLRGSGQARVEGDVPVGDVTVSIAGLDSFIGNAARAGLVPSSQAGIFGSVIAQFARSGEAGRQVFDVSLKNGYFFVNGVPTFIPVPRIP